MAVTVYENKEAGGARVKLDRRVCQTAAGELVEAGHPDAATLYGSEGKEVSRAEFAKLGGVVEAEPTVSVPKMEPEIPAVVPAPKPRRKPAPKPKRKRKRTKKGK